MTEQRAGLVTVAHALRADQEAFGAQSETHAAQLSEFITQARLSTAEMGDRAVKGGEALRELIAEAAEQFRELAESAKAERDEFGQSTLHSMEAVSQAAAEERRKLEEQTRASIQGLGQAAEETRKAAEAHAVTAREQVDQLSEAAFSAGQKANQVFEQRLAEARDLIERSAQMVEQAGAATARKLEEGGRRPRHPGRAGRHDGRHRSPRHPTARRRPRPGRGSASGRGRQYRGPAGTGPPDLRRDPGHRRGLPGPCPPQLRNAQRRRAPDGHGGRAPAAWRRPSPPRCASASPPRRAPAAAASRSPSRKLSSPISRKTRTTTPWSSPSRSSPNRPLGVRARPNPCRSPSYRPAAACA
uniref:Uncharacterized protein n=1 Tax=Phenylobacterium glaciei TaxID=2803784 RepID=A0A974S830_9CAUL|nr:hypothetical protein JKL49_19705 [Phenylobacterium glaciei]